MLAARLLNHSAYLRAYRDRFFDTSIFQMSYTLRNSLSGAYRRYVSLCSMYLVALSTDT
jgi:hypothetical protein